MIKLLRGIFYENLMSILYKNEYYESSYGKYS